MGHCPSVPYTFRHVVKQKIIPVATLKQCLPDVVMSVYETRAENIVRAVDDFCIKRCLDISLDLGDDVPLDQEVCFDGFDVVMLVMDQYRAAFEENRSRHCVADADGNCRLQLDCKVTGTQRLI